jgi:hypothetical protein
MAENAGDAKDLALIALGWMRGVLDDYDDSTMEFFQLEAKDSTNLITGLTNLCVALLDHHRQETGRDEIQTLNDVAVMLNLMPDS